MNLRTTLATLMLIISPTLAATPQTVPVWPDLDTALKSAAVADHRGTTTAPNDFVRDIRYPTLTIYLPEHATGPTPAVVICPGGAYVGLAVDKEGHAVARWLNSLGVAGLVLEYRMPRPEETKDGVPLPLQDAREALHLARQHATEWKIDPKKVGIIGFSAGGHLASTVLTKPADDPAARADFGILMYPVITMHDPVAHKGSRERLLGPHPTAAELDEYSSELHVTDQTPPTFLALADNDPVHPENSLLFFAALRAHKVPAELHIFSTGGHGFGLGTPGTPPAQWPALCATWLCTLHVLPAKP